MYSNLRTVYILYKTNNFSNQPSFKLEFILNKRVFLDVGTVNAKKDMCLVFLIRWICVSKNQVVCFKIEECIAQHSVQRVYFIYVICNVMCTFNICFLYSSNNKKANKQTQHKERTNAFYVFRIVFPLNVLCETFNQESFSWTW